MSNFTFNCPHCGNPLEAQEEWRGQETNCPMCKKEIIVPKVEIVKSKLVENIVENSCSESIRKHLNYASLALQSRAFIEAEREYRAVLQEDPEHYEALYGEMLSKALQTSAANPSLRHIIFSYRKIEQILIDRNDSESRLLDLRKTFFKDFIPLIAEENTKVLNELYENKRKAEFRDAVNTLNALNSRIVLSNPEAQVQQSRGEILFPYLKEILNVKYFLLGIVKISDIKNDPQLLDQCKKLCETTIDINKEPSEVISLQQQISNFLQNKRNLELANSSGVSLKEFKDNELKQQIQKCNNRIAASIVFLIIISIPYLFFILLLIATARSKGIFLAFLFVVILLFCDGALLKWIKQQRQKIRELKSENTQNE